MNETIQSVEELYNCGLAHQARNELDDALSLFQCVLKLDPQNVDACNESGVAYFKQGKLADAEHWFRRTLQIDPNYALALLNLGNVLASSQPEDAVECYKRAMELVPDYLDAMNNLAVLQKARGEHEPAAALLRRVLEIDATYTGAYYNLGTIYQALQHHDQALECFYKAISIQANYPQAFLNIGCILSDRARSLTQPSRTLADAVAAFEKALALRPEYFEAHNNLGLVLHRTGRLREAEQSFRRALELNGSSFLTYDNLGSLLKECDRLDEAIDCFHKAMELKAERLGLSGPIVEIARLLVELERMPIIYESEEELEHYWKHYESTLSEALHVVAAHSFDRRDVEYLRSLLFRITNFYLAYQQKDVKELLARFSEMARKIMKPELAEFDGNTASGVLPSFAERVNDLDVDTCRQTEHEQSSEIDRSARSAKRKIRLGIASEFLYNHNGSFWAYGWLSNLPREDYELFCYSFNGIDDEISKQFAELGTFRRLVFRSENYLEAIRTIRADSLDVLLLPDVGMGSANSILALTRLAPVQCASWGHPVTTGSVNIDFYLTGDLMETDDSEDFFTEKLIRLPNVGYFFEEPDIPLHSASRADFGLPRDKVLFGCVQSHFKYLPKFDFVYPQIAKLVPDALFLFVDSKNPVITKKFRARLSKSFLKTGIDFERSVRFLPRMPRDYFLALLRVLDVNLDSIGWSGGITTLRSIAANLPVVTMPGEFMRSRHSYSMLRMIGMDELVAKSLDEYVSVAVSLGSEIVSRIEIAGHMKQQKSRLFRDMECVVTLDQFIKCEMQKFMKS